jgi:DNA modification methylase
MGSEKADLINTDPPYNVAYGETKNPKHNIRQIENDSLDTNAWKALNLAVIENIKAFYKGGDIYLWGVSGPEGTRQRLWLADTGFHWSAAIIWKKQQIVLIPANYQRLYESCFYGQMAAKTTTRSRKATDHKETHS